MRSTLIVAAVLGALGALAWVHLGGALGQLSGVLDALPSARVADSVAREPETRSSEALEPNLDVQNLEAAHPYAVTPADIALADAEDALALDGDEHIKQWLAADPEFQRAAEEFLNDPDPHVRQEAQQLLRELGASVPEASAER